MKWREHRGVIALLIAFVTLGVWYSVTTPLFETPDEREHFAFVQYLATGRGLPVQSEQPTHLAKQEGSQPPLYYALSAALTFWIDTSDFPALAWENPHYGYNVPGIVNDNKNLFIHTSAESFPYRNAVLAMRLARWLSVTLGALAVLFTYLLAREIFPARNFLALSAAAIVAFTPQFLFISGAVSNDSTITALSALSLWLIARVMTADRRPTTIEIALLGISCGLAAIAKVSGVGLFALVIFSLGLKMWNKHKEPNWIRVSTFYFCLFTFAFSLVAGWWYIRNLMLYGELTGTEMMSRIFFERQAVLSFDQFLAQLNEVWETFWVGFGWGNIRAQPAVYQMISVFVLVSFVGLLKFLIFYFRFSIGQLSRKDQSQIANRKSQILIPLAWLVLIFAALVRWMIVTQAPHGRLMFPALPAIAVLLVFGLTQWQIANSKWRMARVLSLVHLTFVIFLFALASLAPLMILRPAYAYPQTLSESDGAQIPNRVDIAYDDKIKLLGYVVSSRTAYPGGATELTLYWQAPALMDEDYSIGIRVLDTNQRVIGKRDTYPGHGMLPTRLWRAGQIIRDVYWLPINADAPEFSIAQIQIVVYDRISKRDLVARDPRGEIITPFIGQIEIASR
ncbi:MAG: phospholipid carrier-dependent glycosyltransferase [Chloroflexi bacterium]|nr:phospholipid carrier-dependent glycosyltransferase [Chloroflexota bacterium]